MPRVSLPRPGKIGRRVPQVSLLRPGKIGRSPLHRILRENREVKRSGTADLPLHGGRVPHVARRAHDRSRNRHHGMRSSTPMALPNSSLDSAIPSGSRRLEPLWAWTGTLPASPPPSWALSSAASTPASHDLGFTICGGRGRHSRRTPDELRDLRRPTPASTANRSPAPAGSPPASTTMPSPTDSSSTCTPSSFTAPASGQSSSRA